MQLFILCNYYLQGSIHLYDYANPGVAELLSDTHFGNFVGIDFLAPGNQHCVVSLKK